MLGVIETLEKARDLAKRIKRAKNDLHWMSHNTETQEKILAVKIKQFEDLSKEIPSAQKFLKERREHLNKLTEFVAKHENSIGDADEIERVAAKIMKMTQEVEALKAKIEEQTNGLPGSVKA
jgi:predicted  nucleic acid-binding Zn-ribbon protein